MNKIEQADTRQQLPIQLGETSPSPCIQLVVTCLGITVARRCLRVATAPSDGPLTIQRSLDPPWTGGTNLLQVGHVDVSRGNHASILLTASGWRLQNHGGRSLRSTTELIRPDGTRVVLRAGEYSQLALGDVIVPNGSGDLAIRVDLCGDCNRPRTRRAAVGQEAQ